MFPQKEYRMNFKIKKKDEEYLILVIYFVIY